MTSGEIRKIPKRHPKQNVDTKIVGAKHVPTEIVEPKVLDQRTRSRPVQIETTEHGEIVTVSSHTRSKPRKKDEPEVRLRAMTPEQKQAWEAVKGGEG